jgi:hypothetical protein
VQALSGGVVSDRLMLRSVKCAEKSRLLAGVSRTEKKKEELSQVRREEDAVSGVGLTRQVPTRWYRSGQWTYAGGQAGGSRLGCHVSVSITVLGK